jgi:N-acetylglucosaminyl-diphospho-decaprenol L-rhamnosyltransferase
MTESTELAASIIVVTYNDAHQIERCLDAVFRQTAPPTSWELIVVDNGSQDGCSELVRALYPQARLIAQDRNLGFAGANNRAAALARGKWVVFLNSDTEVDSQWLENLLQAAESAPDVGGVHGGQRFHWSARNGAPADANQVLIPELSRWGYVRYESVGEDCAPFPTLNISGASAMLRRDLLETMEQPFDESFFMYCEDCDLALRLNARGYRILAAPGATLDHYQKNPLTNGVKGFFKAHLAIRNGWRMMLKNMYVSEFVLYVPSVLAGSLVKPLEFPGPLPLRVLAGGTLLLLSLVFLPAAIWHYLIHPDRRRQALSERVRPRGWLLHQLTTRDRFGSGPAHSPQDS